MAALRHRSVGLNTPAEPRAPVSFQVERFEYAPADLVLRLWLRLSFELPGDAHPKLLIERAAVEHCHEPLLASISRAPLVQAIEWRWRGSFAVPPELASDPRALFALSLREDLRLVLPEPRDLTAGVCEPSTSVDGGGQARSYYLRRRALPLVVATQLCALPGWMAGGALADGSAGAGTGIGAVPTPEPPTGTAPSTPQEASAPPGGTEPAPAPGPQEAPASEAQGSSASSSTPQPTSVATDTATSLHPAAGTSAPSVPSAPMSAPEVTRRHRQSTTSVAPPTTDSATDHPTKHHRRKHTSMRPRAGEHARGGGDLTGSSHVLALSPQLAAAQAAALAASLAGSAASIQALDFYRIPLFLLPIYQAAAAEYQVPWQILAAINEVETDYGSDLSVSSAGAVGWMQFMPATWIQYGVDALDAGYADPYNPVDAIFASARYLQAAGALRNLRAAILAYNHSDEYVQSVLLRARLIAAYPHAAIRTLTGLIDARTPVDSSKLTWGTPLTSAPKGGAHAKAPASSLTAKGPGSALAPPPVASGASASAGASAQPARLVELLSAPSAAVVAVQDGRVIRMGASRELGRFLVLRDVYGDVFTYAKLGGIDSTYLASKALRTHRTTSLPIEHPGPLTGALSPSTPIRGKVRLFAHPANTGSPATARPGDVRRSLHAELRLPLRVGSVVSKGTVLGVVRVPPGAKDGHLRFAIQPAGDPETVDPRPILANWKQLERALHLQGAHDASIDAILQSATSTLERSFRARQGASRIGHSARTNPAAPAPFVTGAALSAAQWDRLIVRIGQLRLPSVSTQPSTAAIPDS
jgi:membrane-bound lytic murein transglycosylase B